MEKKAERLKLAGWSKCVNENNVTLVFYGEICALPKLSKILLGEGFESALTERFCQDDVEEYFGYQ